MNNKIKVLIGVVVGIASGAGTTYAIMKDRYNRQLNDEVRDIKEYYERLYSAQIEELNNRITLLENSGEPQKKEKKSSTASKKVVKNDADDRDKYEKAVKTNYNAISASKDPEEPVTSKKKTTYKKSSKQEGPKIITLEEYTADKKHEKVTYTYLDQEDMIVDENNEPVVAAEDEIGTEFKELDCSEDGSCIYIRNDSIGKDFEIIIDVYHTYKQFLIEQEEN